jgi:hypothetical protein
MPIIKHFSVKETKIHRHLSLAFKAQRDVIALHLVHSTLQKLFKFVSRNDQNTSSKNEEHKCLLIIVKIVHVWDIVLFQTEFKKYL